MECVHVFISLFPYWEQSWRNDDQEQIEKDFPGIHDELRLRNTSHYEDKLICKEYKRPPLCLVLIPRRLL